MPRKIPLPRGWNRRTKAAILHILAMSDRVRGACRLVPQPQRKTRFSASSGEDN